MPGVDEAKEAGVFERGERLHHSRLVVGDHGVAVRRLITRQDQGIEGQRILLGRRELLLRQAADHAGFD